MPKPFFSHFRRSQANLTHHDSLNLQPVAKSPFDRLPAEIIHTIILNVLTTWPFCDPASLLHTCRSLRIIAINYFDHLTRIRKENLEHILLQVIQEHTDRYVSEAFFYSRKLANLKDFIMKEYLLDAHLRFSMPCPRKNRKTLVKIDRIKYWGPRKVKGTLFNRLISDMRDISTRIEIGVRVKMDDTFTGRDDLAFFTKLAVAGGDVGVVRDISGRVVFTYVHINEVCRRLTHCGGFVRTWPTNL